MKNLISTFSVIIIIILTFSSCVQPIKNNSTSYDNSTVSDNVASEATSHTESDYSATDADMFTERDIKTDYDEAAAISVVLNGTSAFASSDSVKISGSEITITEEATYVISGELNNGTIIVNAPDTAKIQLVFDGVDISSDTSAALYIAEADKVFLTLNEETSNSLSTQGSFTETDDSNTDGALFSKQDLTINGNGSLTVSSPAGHGIVCKDDIVITGGNLTIAAASHGIDANDSIRIAGATLDIKAGKDAMHAENSDDSSRGFIYISGADIKAESEGDGIDAGAYFHITKGRLSLIAGGGSENGEKKNSDNFGDFPGGDRHGMIPPGYEESSVSTDDETSTSMKGIKADGDILISGGNITINSSDDAIHSNASLSVSGGVFDISSGDDALHAEDTLTITSGEFDIKESYEGLEALHIEINGGNIKLIARDDGLNAAGGNDQSGFTGGRDGMFGGGKYGGMRGPAGGIPQNSDGSIKISDGVLYIIASGDGIDANGTLEISGGHITVTGPVTGDTATLDYDKSATISGGTFIGSGARGMAQTFSKSAQGVISVSVGNKTCGTKICLKDKSGNTIIEHIPELDFSVIIISSPDIKPGETYTLTAGTESYELQAE